MNDAKLVIDLMNRCDVRDYGEADSDLDDLLFEWKDIDLERDAWLVYTAQGEMVGYAAVIPWRADLCFHIYVDPSQKEEALFQTLLEQCESRSAEIAREGEMEASAKAMIYIAHANQVETELLLRSGYRVVKYIFNMRTDLTDEIQPPAWPSGVSIRSIQPGQDDRAVYNLIQETFERPGRTPSTFDEWKNFMMRPETFIPEIWFLAESDGQLVGACLCFEFTDTNMGWVRQLGVLADWRRQGLGGSLLRHAFAEFKRRGFATAGLAVESDNPRAITFYEGAGMTQSRWYDEYQGAIHSS